MLSISSDFKIGSQRHECRQADNVDVECFGIQIVGEFDDLLLSSAKFQIADDNRNCRPANVRRGYFDVDSQSHF